MKTLHRDISKSDPSAGKMIIFFDGVCSLCDRSIRLIDRIDTKNQFLFAPLQGETASNMIPEDRQHLASIVLYVDGRIYKEGRAVKEIIRLSRPSYCSRFFLPLLPNFLLNIGYRLIARNRYRFFGKIEACELPPVSLRKKMLA